ncbi:mycofactocin-coupled SDR family oxidoreductase [Aeromicrobium ginsengisoli]|uniref:SDR family oxidoreductase n=1 Tax=Aeromicrobium ginsengisoli TaxID=363867 RepID=A0A5M4FEA3_9ACTN|nr:mycofactocin-coupled SDR family oxidoreductase [Aeromicrobium ginsengisoli]KAA1397604.1 SDR family oxidoreductase [Aeromicrobium ginsengisoli]
MTRVALVTGAARGIGAETVRVLCRDGYAVVAVDSCAGDDVPDGVAYALATRAELDAVAAEFPDHVLARVADVRDREALAAAAADGVDAFGRLDAVVAAAAVIAGGLPLWESPDSHLDNQWDVDVKGVWNTAAATIPHLLNGPDPSGGRFVAIASAAGSHGLFHLAAYNTAKHAVIGLVKGLAADLVGTGVTACAVSPGSTRTRMLDATAAIYDLADVEEFASSQLIRRLLEPAEVAATIALCCSLEGAALNGSVVSADGGFGR